MNTVITSKEAILSTCRNLVSEKGLNFLNMRTVAKNCDISLGLLYYYFPSKNDLLIATIESVWEDIFNLKDINSKKESFVEYINLYYQHIKTGTEKYPNFLTIHAMSFTTNHQKREANSMGLYLAKIKKEMLESLEVDGRIKKDVFSNKFTKDNFIDFVLANIINLLMQKHNDCTVFLEVINRIIY